MNRLQRAARHLVLRRWQGPADTGVNTVCRAWLQLFEQAGKVTRQPLAAWFWWFFQAVTPGGSGLLVIVLRYCASEVGTGPPM